MKTNTDIPLSEVERIAVAGAVGSAEALREIKHDLAPGSYSGSATIRVDFVVEKAEPYEAAPTVDLMSRPVIARALVISGFQRENFYRALREAALEAYADGANVSELISEQDKGVVAEIAQLQAKVVDELPKAKRSGSTRVMATVRNIKADTNRTGLYYEIKEAA